ncbi:unnamed protein product [Chondrus crispus]|uniref:Uncharacterized protein n=1 Tax=Chondrus crispus TaxID=2769 RepID=R7QQI7_CHOCR|nr:unnamed protein product [Chondrus crispus]CDF39983.1 unnamed protein product [Chondrus crispus]|eukprot:XP_005710277.1 unnamed protein product [Chondrus crispus]
MKTKTSLNKFYYMSPRSGPSLLPVHTFIESASCRLSLLPYYRLSTTDYRLTTIDYKLPKLYNPPCPCLLAFLTMTTLDVRKRSAVLKISATSQGG